MFNCYFGIQNLNQNLINVLNQENYSDIKFLRLKIVLIYTICFTLYITYNI